MPALLRHRPHLIDGDWSGMPLHVREHYADETGIQLVFVIDAAPDARELLLSVEPKNFAVLAEMMMQSDPEMARAAFIAGLAARYPLDKASADDVQKIHKLVG